VIVEPRPVDQWLAAQPEKVLIIEMPLLDALNGSQMLYTTFHKQYYAAGYGTYLPIIFSQKYPELEDFPSDESIDILENWGADVGLVPAGVQYILVNEINVPPENELWARILTQPRLELTNVIGSSRIYSIR